MAGKRMIALLTLVILLRLTVAALLRLAPYRCWQPLLRAAMREARPAGCADPALVERVVGAVIESERILPVGQCLERALTAWLMLRRRARCTVRLGANMGEEGRLFAHAWLEYRGEVVMGRSTDTLRTLYPPPAATAEGGRQGGKSW